MHQDKYRLSHGWPGVLIALVVGPALLGGCAGGAVYTMPIMRSDLPAGQPLLQKLPIHEAYYWTDADGHLNIAMRYQSRSLFGPALSSEWLMSLVLEKLPAGRERLYQIATTELRMLQIHGADRRRGRSFAGVVVIEAPRNGSLKGRFHATVQQQVFSALGGWSTYHRGPAVTEAGRFTALENPIKGREILARTVADGMERAPAEKPRAPTATTPGT